MPTQTDHERQQRALVEHFRSTGYDGRERWISALDRVTGERVVAVRQMEACATMPACAWRDEADDEIGLWGLLRECMLDLLLSFARIVESTMPLDVAQERDGSSRQTLAFRACCIVRQSLLQLETADPARNSYGDCALAFLIAVMLLRQVVEHEALGGTAVADVQFVPHSTNVYAGFLEFLFSKLGQTPIEVLRATTLAQLCDSLERRMAASDVGNANQRDVAPFGETA